MIYCARHTLAWVCYIDDVHSMKETQDTSGLLRFFVCVCVRVCLLPPHRSSESTEGRRGSLGEAKCCGKHLTREALCM